MSLVLSEVWVFLPSKKRKHTVWFVCKSTWLHQLRASKTFSVHSEKGRVSISLAYLGFSSLKGSIIHLELQLDQLLLTWEICILQKFNWQRRTDLEWRIFKAQDCWYFHTSCFPKMLFLKHSFCTPGGLDPSHNLLTGGRLGTAVGCAPQATRPKVASFCSHPVSVEHPCSKSSA